jgi:hypothetical protein
MKNQFYLTATLILTLCVIGCLGGISEKAVETNPPPEETDTPAGLAELHLTSPKSAYAPDEAIPVEMTIRLGKFDLLVPYVTVEGRGAFTKLVVKDAKGEVVKPKYPISMASKLKTLFSKNKAVQCIQGVALKARMEKKAVLEDLKVHYKLVPGDYTLQVLMNLRVYRESLVDQPMQIVEIQRDIARIQANRKLPADAKQEAIDNLKKDIEMIESKREGTSEKIYLPIKASRGAADIESNVFALTIQ